MNTQKRSSVARQWFPRLASLVVIAAGWLLFARLAREVLESETQQFDNAVLTSLRVAGDAATPVGPSWLLRSVMDLSSLGGVTVLTLLVAIAVAYLMAARQRGMALYLLVTVLGGWALETLLKWLIDRPRPTVVPQLMTETTLSFPSGHAMMASVTYLTISALIVPLHPIRAARIIIVATAVILSLAIGLCRVYLGVHYPTDVFAGWCAGATWAFSCYVLGRSLVLRAAPDGSRSSIRA